MYIRRSVIVLFHSLPSTVKRRDLFLFLVHHLFFNTNTDLDTDHANDSDTVPSSCDPDEVLQSFSLLD